MKETIKKSVGRPNSGRKPYKVMCVPKNISKIREWIKENNY